VADLKRLDRDLIAFRVQHRPCPFARPTTAEVPAENLGAVVVEQDDRSVRPLDVAVQHTVHPVPERQIADQTALQDDVGELAKSGEFAGGERLVARAVLDRHDLGFEAGDFREAAFDGASVVADAVDDHQEVERAVRIVAQDRRHRASFKKSGSDPVR